MKNLIRIKNCREERRCGNIYACKTCGTIYQKRKFLEHINNISVDFKSLTYIVLKSNGFGSLQDKIEPLFKYLNEIRLLRKRKKLSGEYFARLEVSFSKFYCGFNPHLNIVALDCAADTFLSLARKHNLIIYNRQKKPDTDTLKSICWYILKYNPIGIERGEAVRKAIKKRNTILYSNAFKQKNYCDELTQIDFSFLGVYQIRSKEEIALREERKKIVRKYNKLIKEQQQKFLKNF